MEERLQKLIAKAGITSRRKAEEMILNGLVTVNGQVVAELGTKANPDRDYIKVDGKLINTKLENIKKVYILLNKPRGYLASLSDPQNRPLVTKLLPTSLPRVHPVGRLDFNTEGLIMLTNDGDLTKIVTSAAEHVAKVYEVKVKGEPSEEGLARLRKGMTIDGKKTSPPKVVKMEVSEAGNSWLEVTLYEGRNNQIRKMFDLIGHSVLKLRRIRIGHLTDQNLPLGKYRMLLLEEVMPFFKKRDTEKAVSKLPLKGPRKRRTNSTRDSHNLAELESAEAFDDSDDLEAFDAAEESDSSDNLAAFDDLDDSDNLETATPSDQS